MKCDDIREVMPDLAAGIDAPTPEIREHLRTCGECARTLEEFRQTMALLDEWQVPEPSPYFDTRLNARLREEAAKPAGWMQWFRKSVDNVMPEAGTAVGDLQALEKNHDLYSNFDELDDLQVQQDVTANP